MMIDKIKPCPFCGEKFPEIRGTFNGGAYVRCPDCGARTANFYNTVEYVPPSTQKMYIDAPEKAINAWNERTGEENND
jgi:DNA-directed RNA polymerase subunit RPC12/RpoP